MPEGVDLSVLHASPSRAPQGGPSMQVCLPATGNPPVPRVCRRGPADFAPSTFTHPGARAIFPQRFRMAVGDPTYPVAAPAQAPGPKRRKGNTSSKGTRVELMAIKLLEAEGYRVHRCVRTGQKRGPFYVSQSNDVFGCIDLVAKRLGQRTRWIQVTADSGIGRKRREMEEVPWDPQFDSVEIWRWVGGARRKHKGTGLWLERQYFQVYHFDDRFALRPDRRIPVDPGHPTLPTDPFSGSGEVTA